MEKELNSYLEGFRWYHDLNVWLQKNGAKFHFGEKIDGLRYIILRFLLMIAGFLAFLNLGIGEACAAGVFLFLLPRFLVVYMNRRDNIRLLPELKLLYHGLEIQIRAGVYVSDALAECYGCVREKRIGNALLDLSGDLLMNGNMEEALSAFRNKFNNNHIDSLCIIVLQAMESGQAVELLGDLTEQIKDMEAAVLSKQKDALDRSITLYQLFILAAVLAIVLYACVTQMFDAAIHF